MQARIARGAAGFLWLLLTIFALLRPTAAFAHDGGIMKVSIGPAPGNRCTVEVLIDEEHLPSAINPLIRPEKDALQEFARDFAAHSAIAFDALAAELTVDRYEVQAAPTGGSRIALTLSAPMPPDATSLTWTHILLPGEYFVQFRTSDAAEPVGQWLDHGRTSEPFALSLAAAASFTEICGTYLVLGFTHILPYGIDHILFVLGLYLLGNGLKPLLAQVTAFTVAHSVTLGLTMCGHLSLPSSIVEPAIAASIVFIAIENIFARSVGWWRTGVVFAFGLVHGMGFAGVLEELGLPGNHFIPALVSFNAGVELGQLAVILGAFCSLGLAFAAKGYYRSRIVIPASMLIGAVGLIWTVERLSS